MAYKVRYKNTCTPQEKINFSSGSRWYTDSDCGRKLGGSASIDLSAINSNEVSQLIGSSPHVVCDGGQDFIFIKNLEGPNNSAVLLISLSGTDGHHFRIGLLSGEIFASKVKNDVTCYIKASGTGIPSVKAQYFEASI